MSTTLAIELSELFRRDLTRLLQEVQAFPDDETLWRTLPGVTNSAGNLVLHLEGNLREFIGRLLGGIGYERKRDLEFSQSALGGAELAQRVSAIQESIPNVIASLSPSALDAVYPQVVMGKALTTRQFLIHLDVHLNYHLGQIDYLRRILTGDTAIQLAGL
jgi:hypothetical protein